MSAKRVLFFVSVASIILLAGGVQAQRSTPEGTPAGVTIPYSGRLADKAGQLMVNGAYDFEFALYGSEIGGEPLWSETQEGVAVGDGMFALTLGSASPIPVSVAPADTWLAVAVRGPGEVGFTTLNPRQRLSAAAPASPTGPHVAAACPHDHLGEEWYASVPWSNGAFKVYNYANGPSIWGWNGGGGNALRGYATGTGLGLYAESQDGAGAVGRSINGRGVEGNSTNGPGVYANSTNADSIRVDGAGKNGVYVGSSGDHGVYVASAGWSGVSVASAAVAGVWVASAGQDGVLVSTAGWDGVHVVGPVGGVYYGSGAKGNEDFVVLNTGEVRSKVGFGAPARDFAVIMDIKGTTDQYEPGDVLAASDVQNGAVALAAAPYARAVVGVYSASPGFVGGQPVVESQQVNGIPVAILGIVPCKVSAENGPIHVGDLLVTSSTPGHAMRADDPQQGTVLGKALGVLESGTGLIEVLVMLQ